MADEHPAEEIETIVLDQEPGYMIALDYGSEVTMGLEHAMMIKTEIVAIMRERGVKRLHVWRREQQG